MKNYLYKEQGPSVQICNSERSVTPESQVWQITKHKLREVKLTKIR
jgi:hypothetical protein